MGMLSGLNSMVSKKYASSLKEIRDGEMSLPSFSKDIPMPVRAADISRWKKKDDEYGDYTFFVYGIPFKTFFGRDKSGNQDIFDMCFLHNKYKLCDSSIQIKKKKCEDGKYRWCFYLLTVFSFDRQQIKVDKDKVAVCRLSLAYPIIIVEKDGFYHIGTAEEYLHRRVAIRGKLSRLKSDCQYNSGGHGRTKKMEATERYKKLEADYIDYRMHQYSKKLIDYCIKRHIGKIILDNYKDVVVKTHQDTDESRFLLSSWSYFNLSEKIKYKANKVGIEVEIIKVKEEEVVED